MSAPTVHPERSRRVPKSFRAFTLLEVVVALAILGVSLVAILQISAQAVNSHVYAKKLSVATLLARSKMIDLEQELYDKPLNADDDEDSGDFSDDGWPSYKWRSKIIVPKTNGLSPEQLFGALFNLPLGGMMGGKDGPGDLLKGLFPGSDAKPPSPPPGGANPGDPNGFLSMLGPLAGIAGQQFNQMVDLLQKSVREVHLTVTWKEGKTTESIDLVTHVVSLGLGSDRNGGAAAVAGMNTGGSSWVRADNGAPVPNPQPAPNGQGMVDPADGSPLISQEQYNATHPQGGPMGLPGMPGMPGSPVRPLVPMGTGIIRRGQAGSIFQ